MRRDDVDMTSFWHQMTAGTVLFLDEEEGDKFKWNNNSNNKIKQWTVAARLE